MRTIKARPRFHARDIMPLGTLPPGKAAHLPSPARNPRTDPYNNTTQGRAKFAMATTVGEEREQQLNVAAATAASTVMFCRRAMPAAFVPLRNLSPPHRGADKKTTPVV